MLVVNMLNRSVRILTKVVKRSEKIVTGYVGSGIITTLEVTCLFVVSSIKEGISNPENNIAVTTLRLVMITTIMKMIVQIGIII